MESIYLGWKWIYGSLYVHPGSKVLKLLLTVKSDNYNMNWVRNMKREEIGIKTFLRNTR
jgi:hypothetical protein